MNRPYTAYSPYSLTPTERIPSQWDDGSETVDLDRDRYDDDEGPDEYEDIEEYYEPIDRRWIWIAAVAGVILLVAVICTVVILGGGDSGSVSTTVAPPVTTSQPAATTSAPPVTTSAAPPPAATLPPETVTTVTPTPTAVATPTDTPAQAAPAPAAAPNTITYRVTGQRSLLDLVTVIYTDSQGALQTDVNVALPWAKTVTLDPGVTLGSVTATSVTGQLNCSITDAAGTLVAVQNNNTMIANCTK
ncbi:hypothetical protein A5724_01310 [Mycobacterium sp. ACS1612]|uniref:MmpS family transport accessory protein n=1 Tax=Mycobacterium sp. ACS1612 TaxID=1834117 RepID=UPI0007FCFC80|nr:MmpS family transport accessory protein [Mycobacterium sp. ACS1612]OBF33804.1 hypothetical protein A5724_01310 [Mycobacterium sp. ACS1612]